MSSSSDECNLVIDEPYSQRIEWKDVAPIEQDDGPNDIVRIAYTEVFKDVYSYLRAILNSNEISERALQLTKDAALLNPANYTVWHYRRILLKALKNNLYDELKFISEVIQDNPKNYQVWQHRRCIVDILNDPKDELAFVSSILKHDSKNYHAWQYRQYVIKNFDLWDDELEYVESLINIDVRNNSAWNQRFFVINNTKDTSDAQVIRNEIDYCKEKISKVIDNESVWNYLRAFIRNCTSYPQDFVDFCFKLYEKEDDRSPFLLAFLVDYYENEIERLKSQNDQIDGVKEKIKSYYSKATEILEQLKSKYDIIREKYWEFVMNKWSQKYRVV